MGTAVAKRTATAVKLKPIADVVRQIKTHIYDANNAEARCVKHRLQAGQLLLQLRERIESGEAGNGINWWEWCEQHIERSRKDCETSTENCQRRRPGSGSARGPGTSSACRSQTPRAEGGGAPCYCNSQ